MNLSAALIVRDEERCMERCLRSIVDVVDEIVVVDTGSIDNTVAIAESFGARVLHYPWDGDFSAARNFGLDHVQGMWVLYIDADEYLRPISRETMANELGDATGHVSYRLRLRHRQGFTPYFEYRIWRNRPDIRFSGVIHESITPAIFRVSQAEGLEIGLADLLLEHDGYEGDQRHKHERNLPLLMEQIRNDPGRTYLWDHIGRIHHELGHSVEARDAWLKGVELVRRNGAREAADCLVYFDLMLDNASLHHADGDLVAEGRSLFPDNALIEWGCALMSMAGGDFEEVIRSVDRLLAISPERTARMGVGLNERITEEWAFNVRGTAKFKLGRRDEAALDFARAEAAAPEIEEYRVKRLLAQSGRS
ncbi:MAG TPA: glycosyltransferase [Acidimicrobiales bacterium]|nr:glycosyltransferase [Acidimicrobiales bacterium]